MAVIIGRDEGMVQPIEQRDVAIDLIKPAPVTMTNLLNLTHTTRSRARARFPDPGGRFPDRPIQFPARRQKLPVRMCRELARKGLNLPLLCGDRSVASGEIERNSLYFPC